MTIGGFVQLDRETLRLVRSLGTDYLDLYVALRLAANFKTGYFEGHAIQPGQMAFAWRNIPSRLYPDAENPPAINTLRLRLSKLESIGVISTKPLYKIGNTKAIGTLLSVSIFDTNPNTNPDTNPDTDRRRGNKGKRERSQFVPPTLEQVKDYVASRKSSVDPKRFWEYFDAGDWKDSKGAQVKNWKQKLITWENLSDTNNQQAEEKPCQLPLI